MSKNEDALPEVFVHHHPGVRGKCPACKSDAIVAKVTIADVEPDIDATIGIQHGRSLRVCRQDTTKGTTYYAHPVRLEENETPNAGEGGT